MNDERVAGSAMPAPNTARLESERSRRNQGYADGLAGRERRVFRDEVYGQGFRRGNEKREATA